MPTRTAFAVRRLATAIITLSLVAAVRGYQRTLGRWLAARGPVCRFTPSCSEYFILAVRRYGPAAGTRRGIARVCRCNPWNPGGTDWP